MPETEGIGGVLSVVSMLKNIVESLLIGSDWKHTLVKIVPNHIIDNNDTTWGTSDRNGSVSPPYIFSVYPLSVSKMKGVKIH